MSFRSVPKSVTLNDLERRNGRYIALFHWIWWTYVPTRNRIDLWRNSCTSLLYFVVRVRCRRYESSRSLSHLLMSFLYFIPVPRIGWIMQSFAVRCAALLVVHKWPHSTLHLRGRGSHYCDDVWWRGVWRRKYCDFTVELLPENDNGFPLCTMDNHSQDHRRSNRNMLGNSFYQ